MFVLQSTCTLICTPFISRTQTLAGWCALFPSPTFQHSRHLCMRFFLCISSHWGMCKLDLKDDGGVWLPYLHMQQCWSAMSHNWSWLSLHVVCTQQVNCGQQTKLTPSYTGTQKQCGQNTLHPMLPQRLVDLGRNRNLYCVCPHTWHIDITIGSEYTEV